MTTEQWERENQDILKTMYETGGYGVRQFPLRILPQVALYPDLQPKILPLRDLRPQGSQPPQQHQAASGAG